MEIRVSNGQRALVDKADHKLLNQFSWHVNSSGYVQTQMRLRGCKPTNVYMHRYILDPPYKSDVDHINGNKLDNRRRNLRVCTRSENLQNMKELGGSSKYRGVHWDKRRKKWIASIRLDGKKVYLGGFDFEVDAAVTYDNACRERGVFARTNF